MRNPLRLPPKPAHLLIPLIAIPLLAACDTGGQLPYEDSSADQGVSTYESAPVAEPDPAFNTSPLSKKSTATATASRPTNVQFAATQAKTASATTPSSTAAPSTAVPAPADTTAAATTSSPATAANTATKPAKNSTDQYLLTPVDNGGSSGISYQQNASVNAPVIAVFDANDPHQIDVIVRDSSPVSKAYLLDPQRQQYAAGAIDHKSVTYDPESAADSDIGVHVMTNPATLLSGAGVSIPIVPSGSTAGGILNESHFSLSIPDRAVYDKTWQRWVIHIEINDGISTRSMELLPPKPAAAS
jgi:hypothetical protein